MFASLRRFDAAVAADDSKVLFLVAKQELAIVRKSLQINKDGFLRRHKLCLISHFYLQNVLTSDQPPIMAKPASESHSIASHSRPGRRFSSLRL